MQGNRYPRLSLKTPYNHPELSPVIEWLHRSLSLLLDIPIDTFEGSGVFCTETYEAVREFQRQHHIREELCDGITDKRFWMELTESLVKYEQQQKSKRKKKHVEVIEEDEYERRKPHGKTIVHITNTKMNHQTH